MDGYKLCHKCGYEWSATREFFPVNTSGHLTSPCWACWHEQRHKTNSTKPCCYPGCTNPRENQEKTRCYEHRYYAMRIKEQNEQMYQILGRKTW